MNNTFDVVVLGGGLSGFASAIRLQELGYKTVILEKKPVLGGAATSFDYNGFILDYGPHGFHTDKSELLDYFIKFVKPENIVEKKKISEIYYNGKYYSYPLQTRDLLKNMSIINIIIAGFSFLIARLKMLMKLSNEDCARTWIINRYGEYLYNDFFGPYTMKVWGVNPSDLASDFAQDRIPDRDLIEIIKSLFFLRTKYSKKKTASDRVATHDVEKFYYPKKGIRQLIDSMTHHYLGLGGIVYKSTTIHKIRQLKGKAFEISYRENKREEVIVSDAIISTIPIASFFKVIEKGIDPIKQNLSNLKIRSLILFYVFLNRDDILPSQWVYYFDKRFNRISEVTKFSGQCAPPGKSALCIEISCFENDPIYRYTDDELFGYVKDDLASLDFLRIDEIIDYCSKREKNAYVVYMKSYKNDMQAITTFIEKIPNVYFTGRQGLFKYINMDQAIESGIKVAEKYSAST